MTEYTKKLESLITDKLLPVYLEHYRLLKRPAPVLELNAQLLAAAKSRRRACWLLERQAYEQ